MIDHILAFALLIVVPARALWRSRKTRPDEGGKAARYLGTIGIVGGLLTVLAVDWLLTARAVEALGLGVPTATSALIGLVAAAALLASLCILASRKSASGSDDMERTGSELLPTSPKEVRLFVLLALAVGFGWEVLYRGFLLFYLQSEAGLALAVVISAVAYGAAHGFKSAGQLAASIAAAFAFTIGYALTANLWWLILLHTGLPFVGLLAGGRRRRAGAM